MISNAPFLARIIDEMSIEKCVQMNRETKEKNTQNVFLAHDPDFQCN